MAKKSRKTLSLKKSSGPRKPATPKAATRTFDLAVKEPKRKKIGVKAQVAALLGAGGAYTLEELLKETNAKEVTLRTALSDLRSAKYAGPTGVLPIVCDLLR
jgi:hypothetical protein